MTAEMRVLYVATQEAVWSCWSVRIISVLNQVCVSPSS